jgi:hypothetical protein
VKRLFCNDRDFADLLAQTLKRKENVLPILDGRLRQAEKELAEIEAANLDLRRQLLDPNLRSQPGFMDWLGTEVGHLGTQREAKLREVETLRSQRTEFMEDAGLTDLRKTSRDYLERFDRLTPTERRTIIESVIQKIVVKPDNKLEIVFFSDAIQAAEPVNRWKRSTSAGGDGS